MLTGQYNWCAKINWGVGGDYKLDCVAGQPRFKQNHQRSLIAIQEHVAIELAE